MWADPEQDPRDSGGVSPDGELATLQDYLRSYRLTLRMKCDGLDPEQLARRSSASTDGSGSSGGRRGRRTRPAQ